LVSVLQIAATFICTNGQYKKSKAYDNGQEGEGASLWPHRSSGTKAFLERRKAKICP
jgi:hypothetical protein